MSTTISISEAYPIAATGAVIFTPGQAMLYIITPTGTVNIWGAEYLRNLMVAASRALEELP